MSAYQFQMSDDQSRVNVIHNGSVVGAITNGFFGLTLTKDSRLHGSPLHDTGPTLWDEFYAWEEDQKGAE